MGRWLRAGPRRRRRAASAASRRGSASPAAAAARGRTRTAAPPGASKTNKKRQKRHSTSAFKVSRNLKKKQKHVSLNIQNQGGRFDKYTPKTREDDPKTREDDQVIRLDSFITLSIGVHFRRDKTRWKALSMTFIYWGCLLDWVITFAR